MHHLSLSDTTRIGLVCVAVFLACATAIAAAQQETAPQPAASEAPQEAEPQPSPVEQPTPAATEDADANLDANTDTAAADTATDVKGAEVDENPAPATNPTADNAEAVATDEPSDAQATSNDDAVQPALFKDVQPGTTTRDEVLSAWGRPAGSSQGEGELILKYAMAPFSSVSVSIVDEIVQSITVELPQPATPDRLAEQLRLVEFEPVEVTDSSGEPLGLAFPERGVLFAVIQTETGYKAAQIILETIDANTFTMRAEKNSGRRQAASLKDLNQAIELNPSAARPYMLKTQLLLSLGRVGEAREAVREAVRLAPADPQVRLTHARVLDNLGEYEQAVAETSEVLDSVAGNPLLKAEALAQLGDELAAGPYRDYTAATEYHTSAIKIARKLWDSPQAEVRTRARKLTIDMHLAVARDVAWGNWNSKREVVPMWLGRAGDYAKKDAGTDVLPPAARFKIGRSTLDAYVGSQGVFDPTDVINEMLNLGPQLIGATDDEIERQLLHWQLALALDDAMQSYHARGQFAPALEAGVLALKWFKRCEAFGRQQSGYSHLVGNIHYRIGTIYAVQNNDHTEAMRWLEKAVPLIVESVSGSDVAESASKGEALVSIAISYWNTGRRAEAIELNLQGIELIERAVEKNVVPRSTLATPYANLARMHRNMGDKASADRYDAMATKAEAGKTRR